LINNNENVSVLPNFSRTKLALDWADCRTRTPVQPPSIGPSFAKLQVCVHPPFSFLSFPFLSFPFLSSLPPAGSRFTCSHRSSQQAPGSLSPHDTRSRRRGWSIRCGERTCDTDSAGRDLLASFLASSVPHRGAEPWHGGTIGVTCQ